MSEMGLKSNKITFTTLIDGYCKDEDIKFDFTEKKKEKEEQRTEATANQVQQLMQQIQ
ncbi:hypothetical protein AHAS_Ahas02G0082100 [Arachis hypogaea]